MKNVKKKDFKINKKKAIRLYKQFIKLYQKRPVQNNKGGMSKIHLFNLYMTIKILNPQIIVESGVFKGLSSWFILQAASKSTKIICFDVDLSQLEYKSKKIKYIDGDIDNYDFYNLPTNSLLILDDHQNQIARLKQIILYGFKFVFFDDNSEDDLHDFNTINHTLNKKNFNHRMSFFSIIKTILIFILFMKNKILRKFNDYSILNARLRDYKYNKNNVRLINKFVKNIFSFRPNKFLFKDSFFDDFSNEKKNGNRQTLIELKT